MSCLVSSWPLCPSTEATPSYRELPEGIVIPPSSGRTPLCEAVLNNTVISFQTGSEDFSFKATRKNIYEENLFKCEDERFELDMLIENNAAAIRALEPLAARIAALPPSLARKVAVLWCGLRSSVSSVLWPCHVSGKPFVFSIRCSIFYGLACYVCMCARMNMCMAAAIGFVFRVLSCPLLCVGCA